MIANKCMATPGANQCLLKISLSILTGDTQRKKVWIKIKSESLYN